MGFFDKLKKAEKPDEGAFTPQETEPAGEPLIGGGKPDMAQGSAGDDDALLSRAVQALLTNQTNEKSD